LAPIDPYIRYSLTALTVCQHEAKRNGVDSLAFIFRFCQSIEHPLSQFGRAMMNSTDRITNVVDEICRRQDHVLKELDQLNQQVESILKSLTRQPEPVPVPIPIPVERPSKAA